MYKKIMTAVILLTSFFCSEAKEEFVLDDYEANSTDSLYKSETNEVLILGKFTENNENDFYKHVSLKFLSQYNLYLAKVHSDTLFLISKVKTNQKNINDNLVLLETNCKYKMRLMFTPFTGMDTIKSYDIPQKTKPSRPARLNCLCAYKYFHKDSIRVKNGSEQIPYITVAEHRRSYRNNFDTLCCTTFVVDEKGHPFNKNGLHNSVDSLNDYVFFYYSPDIKGNYIRKECLIKKE